jgi:hypothetical protein
MTAHARRLRLVLAPSLPFPHCSRSGPSGACRLSAAGDHAADMAASDGFTLVQRRRKGGASAPTARVGPFLTSDVDATPAMGAGPIMMHTATRTWRKRDAHRGGGPQPPEADVRLRRVRHFADQIRSCPPLMDAVAAVAAAVVVLLHGRAAADPPPLTVVVALGLGTGRFGTNTLVQVAFLSLLLEALGGAPPAGVACGAGGDVTPVRVPAVAYDPAFDDADAAVLEQVGVRVWKPTAPPPSGAPGAPAPLSFPGPGEVAAALALPGEVSESRLRWCMFLPHCDHPLTAAVMWAYAGQAAQSLWVCNSFTWVAASQGWSADHVGDAHSVAAPPLASEATRVLDPSRSGPGAREASPSVVDADDHATAAYRRAAASARIVGVAHAECVSAALAAASGRDVVEASGRHPHVGGGAGTAHGDKGADDGPLRLLEWTIRGGSTDDVLHRALDATSLHMWRAAAHMA